mmetsp:Transcript_55879/g.96970  ORF Transcript_55879/g.96970 Transcript_55879/m.96970 type:complete len:332 (+) Transcript_55879:3-998(+)
MLRDDLTLLCRLHEDDGRVPQANEFMTRTPGLKRRYMAEPEVDPASYPQECSRPLPKSQPYATDAIMRPMGSIGQMQIVPGMNEWGILMANSTIYVNGKNLTFDDILYGYDLMFENLALFSHTMWFGVSVQQDPSDAFQLSSLLWKEQPDLLIEIGTNTGGGAIFYASVMREYNPDSLVLTIDPKDPALDWAAGQRGCPACKDVRCTKIWHSKNVKFIHGYSSEAKVLAQVEQYVPRFKKVMVMHDGSHFYDHVLEDLNNYDRFTPVGSYMVVQDTKMTRMYTPFNKNPYPLGAVEAFMKGNGRGRYVIDKQYEYLLYSQHHNGWLRKMRP